MQTDERENSGNIIVETLRQFQVNAILTGIFNGPSCTLYQLSLLQCVNVNSVFKCANDIEKNLGVEGIRIFEPVPSKAVIWMEVPNRVCDTVDFCTTMSELKSGHFQIPMVLGKNVFREPVIIDLADAPHILIAGSAGSGKSVCINSLICSVLCTKTPQDVKMILIDPKMVELNVYNGIPHLLTPVITEPCQVIKAMDFIVNEMERRTMMFTKVGVKNIEDYNKKVMGQQDARFEKLSHIMVIVEEFSDLMIVIGKELESYVKKITSVARFIGVHLVFSTQNTSADVITDIISDNFPSKIAFKVSSRKNSMTIIGCKGAEKLLGCGDMLYLSAQNPVPQRIQGAYIDSEIEDIVNSVKQRGNPECIKDA